MDALCLSQMKRKLRRRFREVLELDWLAGPANLNYCHLTVFATSVDAWLRLRHGIPRKLYSLLGMHSHVSAGCVYLGLCLTLRNDGLNVTETRQLTREHKGL